MAKSQALIFAEAQIQNQNAAIAALEAKMGELLLALATKPAQALPVQAPVATPRRDDWLPRYDACSFSRPVIAIFDDADLAFEYRAQRALETGDTVAVKKCRAPDGYAIAAVY